MVAASCHTSLPVRARQPRGPHMTLVERGPYHGNPPEPHALNALVIDMVAQMSDVRMSYTRRP